MCRDTRNSINSVHTLHTPAGHTAVNSSSESPDILLAMKVDFTLSAFQDIKLWILHKVPKVSQWKHSLCCCRLEHPRQGRPRPPDPGRGWSLIIEPVTAANFALQILLLSRQASIHSVHCTSGQRDHQQIANTLELSSWEITQPNLNLGTFYDTELNSA